VQADKSQNLQLTHWRPRTISDGIVPAPKLATQEPMFQFQSKSRKSLPPAKAVRQKESPLSPGKVSLYLLLRPSTNRMKTTYIKENNLLHSVYQFRVIISSQNTLTDTPKIKFDQIPGHPMILSSWHIKLIITEVKSLSSGRTLCRKSHFHQPVF
jgi:hypothetical protein